jgi:aldehyde dehydrogenase (NAD+)
VQASGQLRRYDHHIDGANVPPRSREYLPTEDPFTGNAWALIARGSAADADAAVEAADKAFHGPWSRLSATERGHLL